MNDLVIVTDFYGNYIVLLFVFYASCLYIFLCIFNVSSRDMHCKLAKPIKLRYVALIRAVYLSLFKKKILKK